MDVLSDLNDNAEYIELENFVAAKQWIQTSKVQPTRAWHGKFIDLKTDSYLFFLLHKAPYLIVDTLGQWNRLLS